jgi:hypothetical protein
MESENTEQYMRKLKESILINQGLLTMVSETHKELNDFNQKFQSILQQVFEQSKDNLPFFESLTGKLSEEENQVLIHYVTQSTSAHQQFFEIWKAYKDLESKASDNLSAAAGKIKTFTLE